MNHYEKLVAKQAELSTIVAKLAAENRAPSAEEKTQLDGIQTEIKTIREDFESKGREAFLRGLETAKPKGVVLTKEQRFSDAVKGSYPAEYANLSIGRLLNGYINHDWTGAELEMKAMTSSPTSAGGILIPAPLSARIIDLARNEAAVFRAGAQTVPMSSATLVMARATGDVTAAWYAANAAITESDAAFDSVTFTAHKLAVLVRVENELLADAIGIDAAIERSIGQAIGLELDRVALLGSGTPPEPRGVLNFASINNVPTVGTLADFTKFVDAIALVRGNNFSPNAILMNARNEAVLAKLVSGISGDKTPLVAPEYYRAVPRYITNQLPNADAFVGDFNQLMVGLRQNVLLEVSREADDAFSKDQTMIRATFRADVQLTHVKAFCSLTGIS
jgi:HK97 family phage major capsid protein